MLQQTTSVTLPHAFLEAHLAPGSVVHIWFKARAIGGEGRLFVTVDGIEVSAASTHRAAAFQFVAITISSGGLTQISYDDATTAFSVVYAFQPEAVMKSGIHILHRDTLTAPPKVPDGYHFRPPFGWMNDPNGFGRFGGKVHLFYQHYPHGLRWNTMHWGHAISEDFVHWTHLPMFLFPPDHLSETDDGRGGTFSGSAIPIAGPQGDEMRVFYTEHVLGREPEEQIQLTATSHDGIAADVSEILLPSRPTGLDLTADFRDPYVFKGPNGLWKMLLGSRDGTGGVILLYETADPNAQSGWRFLGIIHREDRFGSLPAECPCIVPVGGDADHPETRWALMFGLLTSHDPITGRPNLTFAVAGRFDGRTFAADYTQELDFACDAYAFQAFIDRGEPVGIAWLANWADFSKNDDFPTAMTLPRRVLIEGDTILTPPIAAVDSLRHLLLDNVSLAAGAAVPLGNGAVEIVLELVAPGDVFDLVIDHPDVGLGVRLDDAGLAIVFDPRNGKTAPWYRALGAKPKEIRIFLDAGSIEVFADEGRWTGTKRIPGFSAARSATLSGAVASANIWQLKL
jgi:beta-fructofuranosidase